MLYLVIKSEASLRLSLGRTEMTGDDIIFPFYSRLFEVPEKRPVSAGKDLDR